MHEAALAIEVMRILEAQRGQLRVVRRVVLEVGTLSCVDPAALRVAVETALPGTIADGANVDVIVIPARARCLGCGHEETPDDRVTPCSACGSPRRTWLTGEALRVRSVEGIAA